MPLLMCPNDNSPMTTVDRSGVQFDMCPSCRGVWLDRGEMEKLMEAARNEAVASMPPPQPQARPAPPPQQYAPPPPQYDDRYRRRDYDDDDDYKRRGYRKHKSIFDIFD